MDFLSNFGYSVVGHASKQMESPVETNRRQRTTRELAEASVLAKAVVITGIAIAVFGAIMLAASVGLGLTLIVLGSVTAVLAQDCVTAFSKVSQVLNDPVSRGKSQLQMSQNSDDFVDDFLKDTIIFKYLFADIAKQMAREQNARP